MEQLLDKLAHSVASARDLQSLTRPLLELLETVTSMESTYLTMVDDIAGEQHILYSRNTQDLQIPEGLAVPWHDTLCKRALEENRPYTDDVGACWGDSEAARALGIRTYLSQPVRRLDGGLYGTLCAASARRVAVDERATRVLGMFATLIAHEVEREQQLQRLQQSNAELSAHAMIDPLSGVANRRMLVQELRRVLATAQRENRSVQIAFVDLDGFKAINDRCGHEAGDQLLVQIARRLAGSLRAGDLVARYGGDEFVVVTTAADPLELQRRIAALTAGRFTLGSHTIDYPGASVGVIETQPGETDVDSLLARADAAMYSIKKTRVLRRA